MGKRILEKENIEDLKNVEVLFDEIKDIFIKYGFDLTMI